MKQSAFVAFSTGYLGRVGICEKIVRTPIPRTYSTHTTRFTMVYICGLPLALWSSLGWATLLWLR
jgi:ion channel-forming bestrophin family protein